MMYSFEDNIPSIEIFDSSVNGKSIVHSGVSLFTPLSCGITILSNTSQIRLDNEDVVLIARDTFFSINASPGVSFIRYTFPKDFFAGYTLPSLIYKCEDTTGVHIGHTIRTMILRIVLTALDDTPARIYKVNGIFWKLCDYLVSSVFLPCTDIGSSDNGQSENQGRIKDVLEYIQSNYAENLSLSLLSEMFHFSLAYMSRFFKNSVGVGFKEYLTDIRLAHASEQLIGTDRSVLDISLGTGFASSAQFAKSFKVKFGTTPTEFRSKYSRKNQSRGVGISAENRRQLQDSLDRLMGFSKNRNEHFPVPHVSRVSLSARGGEIGAVLKCRGINVGIMSNLLDSTYQKQLIMMHDSLHFEYVRFEGWFYEISIGEKHIPQMNYRRIDLALDFLIQNGMKPYIQLGFKPRSLSGSLGTMLHNQLLSQGWCADMCISNEMWKDIIETLFSHLLSRFGRSQMRRWIFELWMPDTWKLDFSGWDAPQKYCIARSIIKKYVPEALVGGCEFKHAFHSDATRSFGRFCHENDCLPDFVSYSSFPYDITITKESTPEDPGIAFRREVSRNPSYFRDELKDIHSELKEAGLDGIPLFISLWNITVSTRLNVNDSCFKGAWMMKNLIESAGLADMICYWFASDIESNHCDIQNALLVGAPGLVTLDGIRKPSYYALQFIEHAGDTLVSEGEHCVLIRQGSNNYSLLLYNVHIPFVSRSLQTGYGSELIDLVPASENRFEKLIINLSITNMEPGVYSVRLSSVNRENGSVFDVWNKWPHDAPIRDEDIDYLKHVCVHKLSISTVATQMDVLNLSFALAENEFAIAQLQLLLN